jgi:S1-C subfamily serine protease
MVNSPCGSSRAHRTREFYVLHLAGGDGPYMCHGPLHGHWPAHCRPSFSLSSSHALSVSQIPRGVGSGFLWDEKGHVITNAHVVGDALEASVTLYGGDVFKASVVGRDSEKDVAVLLIKDLPKDRVLRPLKLGSSSNLLVGQRVRDTTRLPHIPHPLLTPLAQNCRSHASTRRCNAQVFALGNPFSLDLSMTSGIVSGLGREIGSRSSPITNVIQLDASINPGNSGGPLLDSQGRCVGINTAIIDPTGTGISSGVGFAIPVDSVKGMVEQILSVGRVVRPALGITIAPLPSYLGKDRKGVLVVNVRPGGPADVAGMQPTRR